MSIPFEKYKTIKDRVLICYSGSCTDYLVQLRLLRPNIEATFPGIQVYLGSRQEFLSFLGNDNSISIEALRIERTNFGLIINLESDLQSHPVYEFLKESYIPMNVKVVKPSIKTVKCIIVKSGNHPTKDLTTNQLEKVVKLAKINGYCPEIGEDINGAGWVMGAESAPLFEAAGRGIKTSLVETGYGTYLYSKMFPNNDVLKI